MTKKIIIDRDELFDLYINQNKNREEIAKKFNTTSKTISVNLKNFKIKKTIIDKDKLFDLYINQNKTLEQIASLLHTTRANVSRIVVKFGIKKDMSLIQENMKKTCLEKYGVDNVFKSENLKKELKEKNINLYGVDNYSKTEECKEKVKNSFISHYGSKTYLTSEEGKKNIKKILLDKYGTENVYYIPAVQAKKKETLLKKYGVDNYSKTEDFKIKCENTCLSRYGFKNYSKTKECKEKIKKTCLERYGVDCPLKNEDIKQKIVNTNIKKYGVEHISQSQEYKIKIKQNCLDKYSVNNANQKHITNYDIYTNKDLFVEKVKELKNTKALSKFFNVTQSVINKKIIETQSRQYVEMFRSYPEIEIAEILTGLGVEFICNTREIISPLELDFYIPSHNIAIEFNGLFWHQDKDRMYHYNKSKLCEDQGIKLIHIWEHEWDNKREKIINYIKDLLKINITKLYARNCVVKELDSKTCAEFLEQNHLQGKDRSSLKYGLFHNEELVSIMSWCKPRFNKNFDWELSRYAVKCGYVIVGGASKLFKNKPQGKLISYQDVAKFTGNLYNKLGFKLSHVSKPNYVWLKDDVVLTRYQCQMKDEVKNLSNLGFSQVFDCGNKVWVY